MIAPVGKNRMIYVQNFASWREIFLASWREIFLASWREI
jgi:hypothetical protein